MFGLLPAVALAAERTSARGGAWEDPATWLPEGVPGTDDRVTVLGPHIVRITSPGATAATLTVGEGGELALQPGSELWIGVGAHPSTGANSMRVHGILRVNHNATLFMDSEADDQINDRIVVAETGEFHLVGREVARGQVSVPEPDPLPGETDLMVTDETKAFVAGEHVGRYLMFVDGFAASQVYDIIFNSANGLLLDQTADPHGIDSVSPYTHSVGRVRCGGDSSVSADLGTGADPLWDDVPTTGRCYGNRFTLGECFVGSDIEIGGLIYHSIDFYDDADSEDRFLIRGQCPAVGAQEYVLRHWNSPSVETPEWTPPGQPHATMRVRMFPAPGDHYLVYEPARLTVPPEHRSSTDDSRFTSIEVVAGGTLVMRYFDYGYGSNGVGTNALRTCTLSCTAGGIDNTQPGQLIALDYGEFHHHGGTGGLTLAGIQNATFSHVWERDSVLGADSQGHGVTLRDISSPSGPRVSNVTLHHWRWSRLNDEPATLGDFIYNNYSDGVTIHDSIFEYIP